MAWVRALASVILLLYSVDKYLRERLLANEKIFKNAVQLLLKHISLNTAIDGMIEWFCVFLSGVTYLSRGCQA